MWNQPWKLAEGQGGVGPLLVVGPEGDMGRHHLVRLSRLCALQTNTHSQASARPVRSARLVCALTDVLVGHQLPALGSGLQRACI